MVNAFLMSLMFVELSAGLPFGAVVIQADDVDGTSGNKEALVRWFRISETGDVNRIRSDVVPFVDGRFGTSSQPVVALSPSGDCALMILRGETDERVFLQAIGRPPKEQVHLRRKKIEEVYCEPSFSPCGKYALLRYAGPHNVGSLPVRTVLLAIKRGRASVVRSWKDDTLFWAPDSRLVVLPGRYGLPGGLFDQRAKLFSLGPLPARSEDIARLSLGYNHLSTHWRSQDYGQTEEYQFHRDRGFPRTLSPQWRYSLSTVDTYDRFYESVMPIVMTLHRLVLLGRQGPELVVNYPSSGDRRVSTCFAAGDRYFGFFVDPKPEIAGEKTAEHFWYKVPGYLNHRITRQLHLYDIERRRMHAVTLKNAVEQGFELEPQIVATAIQFVPDGAPGGAPPSGGRGE